MTTPTRSDPLPWVLVVLTVTTGLVDAVSVLGLGRVFTANITGNVVFLGFAAVGVPGFSVARAVPGLAAGSTLAGGRRPRRGGCLGGARGLWAGPAVGAAPVSLGGLAPPLVVTGACILLVTVAYAAHPASKRVSSAGQA